MVEQSMAMRKRDEVFPNAAAIDVGASSHWTAVPPDRTDQPVREAGVMTAICTHWPIG
jgi:transposase